MFNVLDGWSFYPLEVGLWTFALASGLALVRGQDLFAPFMAWAAVVLGLLGLVPIVGLFAAIVSGIWAVIISLTLFARSDVVDGEPVASRRVLRLCPQSLGT